MSHRLPASIGAVLALAFVSLAVPSALAQIPSSPEAAAWTPPRTADGEPDLQGFGLMPRLRPLNGLRNLRRSSF